ncbi:myo-inositol-1(or 4)-monophosphatase [Hamadaea flava]|uniref:inositol-phosphate phosphatase n=1 Tax=Hamadaea flava TaxID=1742688 RepID=A0ABV8LVD1_9ACTN|nr:inositol monophosphatase family protein [Hamadaea flava]MCP2327705.1 myo-inositol-1(or 4)-monophosphatase [Hamadaea flava]
MLTAAQDAVDLAAGMLRTRLPGVLTAKGDRDMASEVDYAVERAVRSFLAERTPDVGFLGEEEGAAGAADGLTWVLDPVDGTVNLVHGIPLVAVSLGLVLAGTPILGVVDTPFLHRRYHAVRGDGAYADGRPIRASGVSRLADAVVAVGDYAVGEDADVKNADRLAVTGRLVPRVQRVRMLGSAAIDLVWVAEGRLDALVMLANKPWDTAAGVVIAREAGAQVVDRTGAPHTMASGETLAGAPQLLDELLPLVGVR